MRTPCSHLLTVLDFCILPWQKRPNGYRTAVPPLGGRVQRTKLNYAIQRTDTSVQATRMHCMDHKHSIHNVKACWSFRWIKQYTHLSVARFWKMCPRGEDFQRKSQKLRCLTDRYMCTSSAHVLYGSQAHHSWCQSVLICPLDQVTDSLVRWGILGNVKFSTEKSEITPPNGQIKVCKQCACIVWTTSILSTMSKCAHLSVGWSNTLTCPLQNS